MKVKKVYRWKVVSEDGFIKEYEYGPYYSVSTLNSYCGFDTEEDAMEVINKLSSLPQNLVLLTYYEEIHE